MREDDNKVKKSPVTKAKFDHAGYKKWQKDAQNVDKKEYNKWQKNTQKVDKKEYHSWLSKVGIKVEEIDYTKGCPLLEKLNPVDGIGKYVKDFGKSDAPQFKGASASKRRRMAVASFLGQKRKKLEKVAEEIDYNSDMGVMDWGTPAGTDQMKSKTPGQKNPKEDPIKPVTVPVKEETEAAETKEKYRDDNSDAAPIAIGVTPLNSHDVAELFHRVDTMTYEDMEELGMFEAGYDCDDDAVGHPVEWDDFDMANVEVVDTDNKITEVLSVQGRLKRRFSARKNKQKLRVARGIALRRGSSPDRLKKRATRGARGLVYKRLLKGRNKSTLPPAEKMRLERMIKMYAPLVQRLSVRLLPNMRKMEINRMKSRKGGGQVSKKYKAAGKKMSSQKAKKFKIKKR